MKIINTLNTNPPKNYEPILEHEEKTESWSIDMVFFFLWLIALIILIISCGGNIK